MSVCYDSSGIPIPCSGWSVYDSYVTDPRYQRYFTIAWTSTLALLFVFTIPSIVNFSRQGPGFGKWQGYFGVYDDAFRKKGYEQVTDDVPPRPPRPYRHTSNFRKPFIAISAFFHSFSRFTPHLPFTSSKRYSSLSSGHILFLLLIPLFIFATLFPESQLAENPNRFGFLALACIPPLFVLSSKNGAINLLLGKSWIAVNFLHRWLGRSVLLLVVCHFGLWTVQWARAGELSEFLSSSKERRGIAAFSFLLLITISSLPSFRRFSYTIFFTLHYVSILGFLIFLNQHTIYARGWATWSVVGIYAVDIIGRIASLRIRWVELEALQTGSDDDGGGGRMTKVMIKGVKGGWIGGQTIDLRLFFVPPPVRRGGGRSTIRERIRTAYQLLKAAVRPFESHPFSIATAPPSSYYRLQDQQERGIELYIKSCGKGTWTDDLYRYTSSSITSPSYEPLSSSPTTSSLSSARASKKAYVLALFFGPYASTLSSYSTQEVFEDKETVSLFAGGSGMSFIIGVLEEIVGRRSKKGKGGQVEVVWVVKEQGHVTWFLPSLKTLVSSIPPSSSLSVSLQIYVTSPSTSPSTSALSLPPNSTLSFTRPHLPSILDDQISRILSPCSHCYPVCKCGDRSAGGATEGAVCPNDEEECVGGCGGVGNANELLFDTRGRIEEASIRGTQDEIEEEPNEKSCCCSKDAGGKEEKKKSSGCCSTSESKQAQGCCSTRYPPLDTILSGVREAPTPLRVRSGGMSVIVCGPQRMTGEVRNAVARVPIAKQVRLGGIDLHVEQFGI